MREIQIIPKIENKDGIDVVSSRVLADQLGKEHSKVIRRLEEILTEPNVASLIIESNYTDKKGETRKEYLLTKDGFTLYMFNIQGYNEFKMAYINAFNQMEKVIKENQLKLPSNYKEALQFLLVAEEEKEKLLLENKEQQEEIKVMKPKASYYDTILQSEDTVTVTQIAADYGLSAIRLNELLHKAKFVYNCNKQWILYAEHKGKGYTKSKTIKFPNKKHGGDKIIVETRYTQKGRLKIHEILQDLGILANQDKELVEDF